MLKLTDNQRRTLQAAARILEAQATYDAGSFLEDPSVVKRLFATRLQQQEKEIFEMACLDNRHRLVDVRAMFTGTVDSASVYPREVVKVALQVNACAVVFAHNHPSGVAEPSRADIEITKKLKTALGTVDVRVLDHIIVGQGYEVSLAERGEM